MVDTVSGTAASRVSLGITIIIMAMMLLPVMDAITKHLGATLPVLQIVWARFVVHLILLVPIAAYRHGVQSLRPAHPMLQLYRTIALISASVSFVGSLQFLPLADALALTFISPLVVTAISPIALGETVGARRWIAVAVGFLGSLIIIRPGLVAVNAGTFLAITAGTSFAFYLMFTRKLAPLSQPILTHVYSGLIGSIVMTAVLPLVWVTPTAIETLLMIAVGAIAAVAHYMVVSAYRFADASVLAPFGYCEIIMSVLLGYVWFGDIIDRWTVLGVAILIASGIYISMREGGRRIWRR